MNNQNKTNAIEMSITFRRGDPLYYEVYPGDLVTLEDVKRIEYYGKRYITELENRVSDLDYKLGQFSH